MRIVDDDVSWSSIAAAQDNEEEEDEGDMPVVSGAGAAVLAAEQPLGTGPRAPGLPALRGLESGGKEMSAGRSFRRVL